MQCFCFSTFSLAPSTLNISKTIDGTLTSRKFLKRLRNEHILQIASKLRPTYLKPPQEYQSKNNKFSGTPVAG